MKSFKQDNQTKTQCKGDSLVKYINKGKTFQQVIDEGISIIEPYRAYEYLNSLRPDIHELCHCQYLKSRDLTSRKSRF